MSVGGLRRAVVSCVFLVLFAAVAARAVTESDNEQGAQKRRSRPVVYVATLNDQPIVPGTARYLLRALDEAEEADAECLVIELDTPGGLVDSTRAIVKRILNSRVPVVVYVTPRGAHAASAGTIITVAAHVAAMAPETTLGSAIPVSISPFSPSPEEPDQEKKNLPKRGVGIGHSVEFIMVRQTKQDGNRGDDSAAGSEQAQEQVATGASAQSKSQSGGDQTEGQDESAPQEEPIDDSWRNYAQDAESAMEKKIINDYAAWLRALSRLRNRNTEWLLKAGTEGVSATAEEALENNVIDLIAKDLDDLLEKLDGRRVRLPSGERILNTKDARVNRVEMWWGEHALTLISHPNVAYILLTIGMIGILAELYTPGWGVPGTVGLISLVLGFFGLAMLPVNYVGLLLIFLAVALFAAEAMVTSYGVLGLAGVICMVMGGLLLVESPAGFMRVSLSVVVPVGIGLGLIMLLLLQGIIRAHSRRVFTGAEAMSGESATARNDFVQDGELYRGKVLAHGEWWNAVSKQPVRAGQKCRVLSRDGLTLTVEPLG